MYTFNRFLKKTVYLQASLALCFLFASCTDSASVDPSQLSVKQKIQMQLTSGAAKSWTITETDVLDVLDQGVSVFVNLPVQQLLGLKEIVQEETSNTMHTVVFNLVGKYELRDNQSNITDSGFWVINDAGTELTLTPKNGDPVRIFEIQSMNGGQLEITKSDEVMANIDGDVELELVTVEVEAQLN